MTRLFKPECVKSRVRLPLCLDLVLEYYHDVNKHGLPVSHVQVFVAVLQLWRLGINRLEPSPVERSTLVAEKVHVSV